MVFLSYYDNACRIHQPMAELICLRKGITKCLSVFVYREGDSKQMEIFKKEKKIT